MRRSKQLFILLGILALVCAATYIVMRFEEHKEKIRTSDEIILELPRDTVKFLSWKYGEEALVFHKNETWLYDEDEAFPVDEEKINGLLEQFEAFGVSFIIEEVEDFGQYGLDNPVCTINLATEEQSYEITLGNFSKIDSERYVSIGDGNVYLVKNDPLDHFDAVLSDMIDHDETPSFEQLTQVRFAGAEAYSIVYEEDSTGTYCAEDVYFAQTDGKKLPLDTNRVDDYLSKISFLDPTNYVTYNATEKELQIYGLDTPELTVTVDYATEGEDDEEIANTFVLNVSRDPEEKKVAEEAAEEDGDAAEADEITAYVRVGESQIVYQISSDDYEQLMKASYNDFRHREVLIADFAAVRQIDISLENTEYTITSTGKEDKRTYYYQEEELDIADFQNALENLSADSFTSERPTEKEEISLIVYLDNENFPEVEIGLYRYDGTYCLAVVDGEPFSLVMRSSVVDLIEAVNAIVLN